MRRMRRMIGIALVAVGVVLLIWGVTAADSFASDVSRFFTGSPTDRAIWLTIGGVAAIVAGGVAAALPAKAL
jgi:hypothetical protein